MVNKGFDIKIEDLNPDIRISTLQALSIKKTKRIDKLEKENKELSKENEELNKEINELYKEIRRLKNEIYKLKNEIYKLKNEKRNTKRVKNERGAGRKAKFSKQEVETMKIHRLRGDTIKEIAENFNCSVGLIHKLINENKGAN